MHPSAGAKSPASSWTKSSPVSLEAFVEACDGARTADAVKRLLIAAVQSLGFDKVALATHGDPRKLGSLSVLAHNWGEKAAALLYADERGAGNPLFELAERTDGPAYWSAQTFRAKRDARKSAWMAALNELGIRSGVSQRVRGAVIPASCSLAPAHGDLDTAKVRAAMRVAAHAFHLIVALRRPRLDQPDTLTAREYQCMALAALCGLRPREVAETLGVSVNTVRSARKNALSRLQARSAEEAVWRMVETGQMFSRGRAK
jgi:DNA-binding CsgD family transcriptional regulator